MDVGPASGQFELRANVREVLAVECPPDLARQAMTDPQCWQALWKSVVDLGWTALASRGPVLHVAGAAAPTGTDTDTHFGFGSIDLAVVLEECGAALAPIPLVSSAGFAAGVLLAAGPALRSLVAEIADGAVATLAAHAPGHRMPTAPMVFERGRLRGRAAAVPDLSAADLIVTLAVTGGGDEIVAAVIRPGDGVTIEPTESIDPSRPVADLEVDAVPEITAPVDIDAALAGPLLAAAAELVGVGAAALQRSVDHAKSRRQFGKPIGSFQGVKHALADNHVAVERARSLTYAAAARLDDPATAPGVAWTSAALAKAAAGEAAVQCSRTAVQVHGAIAQTWEHDMHLFARRAWRGAAMLGDSRALYHAAGRRFVIGGA
jgi:alkylation response protein AidB-like acyl-CoA dehydrogenase